MSEATEKLIDDLVGKDFVEAKKSFDALIAEKVTDALEIQREEVAEEIFGEGNIDESVEIVEEIEVDFDDEEDEYESDDEELDEAVEDYVDALSDEDIEGLFEKKMSVDIDHMGGNDPNAAKHKIKLKHSPDGYSTTATGKRKKLKKYLKKHYDSKSDAKDIHPDVFKKKKQNESIEAYVDSLSDRQVESLLEKKMSAEIDHTGDHDPNAAKHKIKLKHSSDGYSTTATGKRKKLKKYLKKHYDSKSDAKDIHPDVFKKKKA